jgi:hypothetical protein
MRNRKNEKPPGARPSLPRPFSPFSFPPRPSRSPRGLAKPPPRAAHPTLGQPAGARPSSARPSRSPRPSTDSPRPLCSARVGSCPAAAVAWWGPPISPPPKNCPYSSSLSSRRTVLSLPHLVRLYLSSPICPRHPEPPLPRHRPSAPPRPPW